MSTADKSQKLWGGRFVETTNATLEQLNSSIGFDKRMWKEDLNGSSAYAKALLDIGVLNTQETQEILSGLNKIHKEWETNKFCIEKSDEDIHTANERRLKELIGNAALKLHTGRSRNDQVATDMRLWLREALAALDRLLANCIQQFAQRAQREVDVLMPGYTHLQRAQPVRWSHWLLSHGWSFRSDWERLQGLRARLEVLPLGSGALAGSPLPLDRPRLARLLAFAHVSPNSMHAVGDRDFVAEFLFWASLVGVHVGRLAEDLLLFASHEFRFVRLADAFCTGSSLMPQKRNADALELLRARGATLVGKLSGFMVVLKGLPSTYNKDLQEDKEAMFTAFDSLQVMLALAEGVVRTLHVNRAECLAALSPDMLATDMAYYLVKKGVPFREAHHIAGRVVAAAESQLKPLTALTLQEFKAISTYFEDDILQIWSYERSIEQYQVIGGTSKSSVMKQISDLLTWYDKNIKG